MRTIGGGALLALLALGGGAQAQSMDDARAFVVGLYRAYSRSPEPDYLGRRAREVFSPRLVGLIRRDERNARGEVGALDGDPICDCQDPAGVHLVELEVAPAGTGRAWAHARLQYEGGRAEAITLSLASVGGHWRVDDVHTKDTPSLVQLLGGAVGN